MNVSRMIRLNLAVALVGMGSANRAAACELCNFNGKTLTTRVNEASVVIFGKLSNSRLFANAKPGEPDGATDMDVLTVLKDHEYIRGKKRIVLPRYVYDAEKNDALYVVFAEVVGDRLDPYQGIPIDSQDAVRYLEGAIKANDLEPGDRLGYFYKNLDHPNLSIAADAYGEFAIAPFADVAAAVQHYDPDKILGWIRDKNAPSYQMGLYGLMLGIRGRTSDATVLRKLLEDEEHRPTTGVDGLMGGYCLLDPENGPAFTLEALSAPGSDFNLRWAALRTIRFLLAQAPRVDRRRLFAGMEKAILIPDISDLVIDELCKNQAWTAVERVLSLYNRPDFDLHVVRRAIIRYALKCPDAEAKKFIERLRNDDPRLLADVEEINKFEEEQEALARKSSAGKTKAPAPLR